MKTYIPGAAMRLLLLAAFSALAACGGGGDGPGANNNDPTADAGEPQAVDAKVDVTLEGTGSDSDGQIAAYNWKQTGGPDVTLEDEGAATAAFQAPDVSSATELTFELTVTDNDGATASDDVVVTVAPVIGFAGRVYDGPLAGATVTITVGDREYTAVADDDGNYEVNVGSVDPGAFITITATGGEGQETVELLSIASSFAALQSAAGDDGVLEDSESGAVDVTNISTAKAVLMIRANGGEPIDSDATANDAEKNVNGDEMIRLATVIKLVVDGGYTLPDGVKSTLDLVDDDETSEAFIAAVNAHDPAAYQAMQDAMLSDPALLDAFDASNVPPVYTLLIVDSFKSSGAPAYQYGRGQRYVFDDGGTGHVYTSSSSSSGAFNWTVVDGEIVMTFTPSLLSEGFCNVEGIVHQVRCDTETTKQYLKLVVDGVNADQLRLRSEGTTTYPDNPEIDPEPFAGTGSNRIAFAASAEIPFTADELPGTWAFTTAGPDLTGLALSDVTAGFLEFNANGTGTALATDVSPALAFTWSVANDGALKTAFADGSALIARRLRKDSIAFDTHVLFETAGGDVFSSAGLLVREDGSVDDLVAADAIGFFTLYDAHPYFAIVLQDGGAGLSRNYVDGVPFDDAITWAMDADGIITMDYRWDVDAGTYVPSCDGIANCHFFRQRIWVPVAYDEASGRVFAYERQQRFAYDAGQPENKGAMEFVQSTVRYWGVSDDSKDGDDVFAKTTREERYRKPWLRVPFRLRLEE
ncbi:MAG: hypothetical protein KY410_01030 [Proteobacteria bacterium]|nr:hypothetical protein [Pseudomonadota bacterium]